MELTNHRLSPAQETVITQVKGLDPWGSIRSVRRAVRHTLPRLRKDEGRREALVIFMRTDLGTRSCDGPCSAAVDSWTAQCVCAPHPPLLRYLHLLLHRDKDKDQEDDGMGRWPDTYPKGPQQKLLLFCSSETLFSLCSL